MKCLVYPYSDNMYAAVSNIDFFSPNLEITALIYPKAWEKLIFHREFPNNAELSSDFNKYLNETEAVIISDVTNKKYMYKDILKKIELSLSMKKKIMCCTRLDEETTVRLKEKYSDSELIILYDDAAGFNYESYGHKKQNCVTIGSAPLYRGLDNLTAITYMARNFKELGYKVIVVSPDENGKLLGFYTFPHYVLNNNTDIEQKVEQLNTYFTKLEELTACDIMIVQFPDGLLKYSMDSIDSYGVKAYMMSCAVSVDYFVLTSLCSINQIEDYESIDKVVRKKFGFGIDSCALQPLKIDEEYTSEIRNISFTRNGLAESIKNSNDLITDNESNILFFLSDEAEAYKNVISHCIEKLSN